MAKKEFKVTSNISIEGARLILRNFQGKPNQFNEKGNRNFGVLIDPEMAPTLEQDGWKIKYLPPKNEVDPKQPWLSVRVKFGDYPPIANLITSKGRVRLDEDSIGQLDWTPMANVDLIIRPYNYPATELRPAGVAAYLKSIYVTVQEDDFESKYSDLPYLDDDTEYVD